MDVNIKTNKLIELRTQKAWSQQHLAETANISLRTVQRIEKRGVASKESVLALASAFNMTVTELMEKPKKKHYLQMVVGAIIVTIMTVATLVLYATSTAADSITLAVKVSKNNEPFADVRFSGPVGAESEYKLKNQLKITVVPLNTPDGSILLEAKIYELQMNQQYKLISAPSVLAEYRQPVSVKVSGQSGIVYGFEITPEE